MQTTHLHGSQESQPAGAAVSNREDRPVAQQTEEFHGLRDPLEIIDQDDRRPCYDPDKGDLCASPLPVLLVAVMWQVTWFWHRCKSSSQQVNCDMPKQMRERDHLEQVHADCTEQERWH